MKPSEIRSRILADHDLLRGRLDALERQAGRARHGDAEHLVELRSGAEQLLARLEEHMHWEDLYLLPALEAADAWGTQRATRLRTDHREQRALLQLTLERVRDPDRPATLLALDVTGLVEMLQADMKEEERDLLDPRVLRDDVIGVDVEAG